MKKMKLTILSLLILASGCGYCSKNNELIGQVKKVAEVTPLVCGDFAAADISLGVLRNGVGSMSNEDVVLYVPNESDLKLLKEATAAGQLVKIVYDMKRVTFCKPEMQVKSVEVLK